MYHAIDRKAIAEQLMEGTVTIANTPVNPNSPYHNPNVKGYAFDPDLSRQLLNEAGWLVESDGIRVKDGIRFSFSMINRAGVADRIAIAQVIQAQLKNVGIEITFETLESAAWTQRWRNGQWEGIVSAWFLPADPSITNLYASDGSNNMTGLYDPSLDEVMKQSDTALAFHKRKPYMDKAQQLLAKTALTLPIYFNVVPELVHTRVGNFKGSGANFGSFWNVYEWTIEK
jgi:peptide/nickel transport system substrate-binding protein